MQLIPCTENEMVYTPHNPHQDCKNLAERPLLESLLRYGVLILFSIALFQHSTSQRQLCLCIARQHVVRCPTLVPGARIVLQVDKVMTTVSVVGE